MVATKTDSFLPTGSSQLAFGDALKQAFLDAGFSSVVDDFVANNDRNLIFSHVVDATKTYGTNFLKIRITPNFFISQQILTSWDATSKSGNNGSGEIINYSFNSNSQINIVSLNGKDEYRFVLLSQGGNFAFLGILAPAQRPFWWDLNSFNYGFVSMSHIARTWRSSNLNPYSYTDFTLTMGLGELSSANPITNKRDVLIGLLLLNQNGVGIAGKTSDDFAQCSASGLARNEIIQASGSQYLIFQPGAGAVGIRIV